MAETIGALIFASVEAAGATGAAAFGSTVIVGTLTVNAAIGAAAITAASIGLSYALTSAPNVPSPEAGSQAVKQSIPPRVRGYWVNRLAGAYVLFEADNNTPNSSYDVIAYHHGEIESVLEVFLHDDSVQTNLDFTNYNTIITVLGQAGTGAYEGGGVQIELLKGRDDQIATDWLYGDSNINSIWTSAFRGRGIAALVLKCTGPADAANYSNVYPRGKPEPSVVAKCSMILDRRTNVTAATPNPVVQLIDYLTGDPDVTGGPGLDYDTTIAPVIDQWHTEAALCDDIVSGSLRYTSAGWYTFENKPEDVIGKILSTCDGYLMENGDGTLSLTVGYYREPTEPALTSEHLLGFSVDYGTADESKVNQLDVTITYPAEKYVSIQLNSIRDEDSISMFGLRSQTLDLTWVQTVDQASRLAERAMQRLNSTMSGSIVTTLYGFRYFGKRWIRLQYPIAGLEDCVVEIQTVRTNLLGGQITFEWKLIDPSGYAESIALPKVYREDGSFLLRENSAAYTRG